MGVEFNVDTVVKSAVFCMCWFYLVKPDPPYLPLGRAASSMIGSVILVLSHQLSSGEGMKFIYSFFWLNQIFRNRFKIFCFAQNRFLTNLFGFTVYNFFFFCLFLIVDFKRSVYEFVLIFWFWKWDTKFILFKKKTEFKITFVCKVKIDLILFWFWVSLLHQMMNFNQSFGTEKKKHFFHYFIILEIFFLFAFKKKNQQNNFSSIYCNWLWNNCVFGWNDDHRFDFGRTKSFGITCSLPFKIW